MFKVIIKKGIYSNNVGFTGDTSNESASRALVFSLIGNFRYVLNFHFEDLIKICTKGLCGTTVLFPRLCRTNSTIDKNHPKNNLNIRPVSIYILNNVPIYVLLGQPYGTICPQHYRA